MHYSKLTKLQQPLVIGLALIMLASPAFAQSNDTSSGIATYIPIAGETHPGDIVDLSKNGYKLSSTPYDPSVFGVIAENPSVSFENTNLKGTQPVISTGKVYVRVTTVNGPIHKGDLISASKTPGVGQKATQDGYVIGTALQDYTASDPKAIGRVLVVLNITFNASSGQSNKNLLSTFQNALDAPYLSPLNALRYVLAGIMIVISFVIAVSFFGKVSRLGVEAIGRNPLAGRMILMSVVLHLILAASIILVGVGIAYFVLAY